MGEKSEKGNGRVGIGEEEEIAMKEKKTGNTDEKNRNNTKDKHQKKRTSHNATTEEF